VHAKGTRVYGRFILTDDLSELNVADHFNCVGKQTEIFMRLSIIGGEKGLAMDNVILVILDYVSILLVVPRYCH
jgi:catalase